MADKDPAQQAALKAIETAGPQGKAASFLVQNWKQIIIAWLLWNLLVIGLSIISIYLICTCTVGAMEAGLLRTLGIFGLSGGNQQTVGANSGEPQGGGTIDEDCFVKLVREANSNVTVETAKKYKNDIQSAANATGVNAAAIAAVAQKESTWINHNCSGDKKSRGIMQIQTRYQEGCSWGTYEVWKDEAIPFAKQYGQTISDIMNEQHSFIGGAAILKRNLDSFKGDYYKAFAAYNAGVAGASGGKGSGYASVVNSYYEKYKKCISSQTSAVAGTQGQKIYIHWTGGSYDAVSQYYNYNIKGDGTIVKTAGGNHTFNRNNNSIGITVNAGGGTHNSSKYPSDNIYGTNTFTQYPIKQIQIDKMIELIAKIAKENNIPVDLAHIMTHAEAGSLKDYDQNLVKKVSPPINPCLGTTATEAAKYDAPAIALGMPTCNYGPSSWKDGWPGGSSTRWDFWEKGDEIRNLVKQKLNQ